MNNSIPDTPFILIDTQRMINNIQSMAEMASQAGVKLRPHTKTHKMPHIAHLQLKAGAAGITVAKISEAEVMAQHGVNDIFVAFPFVSPGKIERAVKLSAQINLILGVDSYEGAMLIALTAAREGQQVQVRLEIDTGFRRTGVLYDHALELAKRISEIPFLRLTGIYTYRGAFFNGKPTLDLARAGAQEGSLMVELADRIRAEGIPIADVSIGSTPTAAFAAAVPGVTEIRPGTYVFNDRMQVRFGVCSPEDWAACVLVTVVSRPSPDLIVIDGGSKTFATDVQPNTDPLQLKGYGYIMELDDAVFERLSEEHGMIRLGPFAQNAEVNIGDTLHVVPNHICSTINLHNQVVFHNKAGLYETTPVLARGMLE